MYNNSSKNDVPRDVNSCIGIWQLCCPSISITSRASKGVDGIRDCGRVEHDEIVSWAFSVVSSITLRTRGRVKNRSSIGSDVQPDIWDFLEHKLWLSKLPVTVYIDAHEGPISYSSSGSLLFLIVSRVSSRFSQYVCCNHTLRGFSNISAITSIHSSSCS